jgi:hypothetical protein
MTLVRPVFLCDNVFNPFQYPDVVLTANEEASGFEAERFSTLRREDHWSPTTYNNDAWLKAAHAQVRAVNTVCLWVHNLLGETYRFQISNDDFTTTETLIDLTIPSNVGAGDIDDTYGVVTEDFMWMKRMSTRYAKSFRHFVPAMGANQRPELAGLAGVSYSPNQYDYPYAPSSTEFHVEEQMSDRGVLGRSLPINLRRGEIVLKMRNDFEYETARFHLEQRWGRGHPMLIVHNEAQAERAVMAVRTGGSMLGFETDASWPDGNEGRNQGRLSFQEHDRRED